MIALFKGELSYHEIMREMTFKEIVALRDARIQQLLDEKKAADEARERQARESARNQILRK